LITVGISLRFWYSMCWYALLLWNSNSTWIDRKKIAKRAKNMNDARGAPSCALSILLVY
jgi:hypothetical protein